MEKNYLIYSKNQQNRRIPEIIFTRACCSLGIVIFHYFCRSRGNFKFLFRTSNSNFGFIFVTSFFTISGAVLYYNYPKIISIKTFYYKRWRSIFPSFYICYSYYFVRNLFRYHKITYKIHWTKFFLTLIGLDGYFLYRIQNYYLVGEWFLGAIIIIYIFYPFLLWLMTNNYWIFINIVFVIFYFLMYKTDFFIIANERNIITCLTSFYFGMNAMKFRKFINNNNILLLFAFVCFIILCSIKISSFVLIHQIQGFSFFILSNKIGQYAMNSKLNKVLNEISNLSYIIFLYHHQITYDILNINTSLKWYFHILSVFIIFFITYIISKIHILVLNSVIKTCLFAKFESFFK
jgi:peptidoglycan/LPS O-acetylase OafA/YrhL